MDGFSYNNIFETKGIEYLIIIAFLVLIIPFWIIINKQNAIKMQVKKALGVLSASVLRIPRGFFTVRIIPGLISKDQGMPRWDLMIFCFILPER